MSILLRICRGISAVWTTSHYAMAVIGALVVAALPTSATFNGANGRIAFTLVSGNQTSGYTSVIFAAGSGQLTNPPAGMYDSTPSWSADGSQVAFVRTVGTSPYVTSKASIEIINKDGSGERTLISSDTLDEFLGESGTPEFFGAPAWSPDGKYLAFVYYASVQGSGDTIANLYGGLYRINVDGSGLDLLTNASVLLNPRFSSLGDLAFGCLANPGVGQYLSICEMNGGAPIALTIQQTDGSTQAIDSDEFDWTPDGKSLVFLTGAGIFRVNKDGTRLVQLTPPTHNICPSGKVIGQEGLQDGPLDTSYLYPTVSPDGQSIIAYVSKDVATATDSNGNCTQIGQTSSWAIGSSSGGAFTPGVVSDLDSASPSHVDWQAIPQALTINIFDGHDDPLKGMKVELLDFDGNVIDGQPINAVGGTYVFADTPAPGGYSIQATLTDNCAAPCTPAFDILYAPAPATPAWAEWDIAIQSTQPATFTLNFDETDIRLTNSNPTNKGPLDDMAAIYFRTRQYVDWVESKLTTNTGPTAHFYTYATQDPNGGPFPATCTGSGTGQTDCSYYSLANSAIVLDTHNSDYSIRNGSHVQYNDAPLNVEWHEYTHHLYENFVDGACPGDTNHLGYNNPDSCDSMNEGFASFLPTYAARDILGSSSGQYADMWNLQAPTKAWGYREGGFNLEDFSVAALFWDLTARNGNTESTHVVGADGNLHAVTLTNSMTNLPIQQLWAQMTSAQSATVFALRQLLGFPDPTIDLDGDGVPDVSPVDIPFLMHGFYPIDLAVAGAPPDVNDYVVNYSQRKGGSGPDSSVGETSHHIYNAAEVQIGSLVPRFNIIPSPHANIGLTVLDASGAPLDGATVNMTMSYPGGQSQITQQLTSGSGALVHLEVPPYFDYLLPADASLPTCDPVHDVNVTVTLSVEKYGQTSTESPSFDNCTYYHAVAAATGPAALSYTLTVPVTGDAGAPATTAVTSPLPGAGGWNDSDVTVNLTASAGAGVQNITFSASGAQVISETALPGSSATVVINTEGQTTITYFTTDNDGNQEAPQQVTVSLDKTAPSVTCGAPDAQWHTSDVSIACSASDGTSGLENSSDANFMLSTTVPAGTENGSATTGSRSVCDVAGNCTTAGPIGPIRVDEKPPTITITSPAGNYVPGQYVSASYSCTDASSGVATCVGNVSPSVTIDTSRIGIYTFTVNATDKAGNAATPQTSTYSVNYAFCFSTPGLCQTPAQDVTSLLAIKFSGFTLRTTYGALDYLQTVTITNNSNTTINGPISLVFDNLSSGVTLLALGEAQGSAGITALAAPAGSPYLDLGSFTGSGFAYTSLAPGQSTSVQVAFEEPSPRPIRYQARVLAGVGGR